MKIRRKSLLGVSVFLGVVLVLVAMAFQFPLVLQFSKEPETAPVLPEKGELNPLSNLDFESGEWAAYLHIDSADFTELSGGLARFPCLVTTDISVLRKMKKGWNMVAQGGDIATVTSSILIFKDGQLEFESGIVLTDDGAGLQNQAYGWSTPENVEEFLAPLKEFKKLHRPLIVL